MLSYQHAYHAGNHADILKHYVLTFVLNSLNKKEKPYAFFDTHSGSGLYNLFDSRLQKTGEGQKGIEKLLKQKDIPGELSLYVSLVKKYAAKGMYPGSPEIERVLMRSYDSLILSELHPQEIINLKNNMTQPLFESKGFCQPKIHNRNGWEMLKALTPPPQKRGAVLIDPSYEETADYEDAAKTIYEVHKKWSNAIIMLWYPLLVHRENEIEKMLDDINEAARYDNANIEISNLQLCVYSRDSSTENESLQNKTRLYGSGMLVLNSPWKLLEEGNLVTDYLKKVFYN